jgi:hypothetical protein
MVDVWNTWYNRLQAALPVDTVMIPTANLSLMPSTQSGVVTISDLFFRSGPPSTPHFLRPWSFKLYGPSVLILQLGLIDFVTFFSDEKNNNKHAVDKFTNDFVNLCVKYVRTIRKSAYPLGWTSSSGRPWGPSVALQEQDGSYIYNSAPSTLPIFLMTPFSASRHFVTNKITLDRFVSNALSQVASTLQADGDKSTFWIDTSGWLDSEKDFVTHSVNPSSAYYHPLTRVGNDKVARLLADHICPYIHDTGGTAGSATAAKCPFDRYDHYLGNVYLPQDVDFDRAVLERKVATIKERFKIEVV